MGLSRIIKDTERLTEKFKKNDDRIFVFCKTVIYKECYFNISYKKALRMLKRSTRKNFIRSVKHWENNSGLSRYRAYFHRNEKHISFGADPVLFPLPPDPVVYFGEKP